MSALQAEHLVDTEGRQLYLACPLTSIEERDQRQLKSDVAIVKRAVEDVTCGERLVGEAWPVSVYAPIDHTAPWRQDSLTPAEVYKRNLDQIHSSDGLIVLAENGGSAGVGQELEWGIGLGIPILFLTADRAISRQIQGAPGFVRAQSYGKDALTLEGHVRNFLLLSKPLILDGPRRRASRQLRYTPIAKELLGAWQSCRNPTDVAAQVRVDLRYLDITLQDPSLVAQMRVDTLVTLAQALDVRLSPKVERPTLALPVRMLRALFAAAAEEGWADDQVERLVFHGRAAVASGQVVDLTTMSGWRDLHSALE